MQSKHPNRLKIELTIFFWCPEACTCVGDRHHCLPRSHRTDRSHTQWLRLKLSFWPIGTPNWSERHCRWNDLLRKDSPATILNSIQRNSSKPGWQTTKIYSFREQRGFFSTLLTGKLSRQTIGCRLSECTFETKLKTKSTDHEGEKD